MFLGGNQRDLARAKNAKKQADLNKGVRTDNLTVEQRKARWEPFLTKHLRYFMVISCCGRCRVGSITKPHRHIIDAFTFYGVIMKWIASLPLRNIFIFNSNFASE